MACFASLPVLALKQSQDSFPNKQDEDRFAAFPRYSVNVPRLRGDDDVAGRRGAASVNDDVVYTIGATW